MFIFMALLSSCEKGDSINSSGKRLQRINSRAGDSLNFTTFIYDSQERLIAITDTSNNGIFRKTSIDYNSQDYPSTITIFHKQGPDSNSWTFSLEYENNKVIKKWMNNQGNIFKSNTYGYDAQGRLIVDTSYYYQENHEIAGYTNFAYDLNDNVIQTEWFSNNILSKTFESLGLTQSSFNSRESPYYSFGLSAYFITDWPVFLSKHNVVQNRHRSYTDNFSYDYGSGELVNRIWVNKDSIGAFYPAYSDFIYK